MEQQIKSFLKSIRSNESVISTLLGVAVVITVGSLLFNYFKSKPSTQLPQNDVDISEIKTENLNPQNTPSTISGSSDLHEVAAGETLWSISEKYFKSGYNWVDIAAANKLKNGDLIEKGQKLVIPDVPAKKQTVAVSEPKNEIKVEIKSADSVVVAGSEYEIKPNDSLWKIAVVSYGDGYQWVKIYNENKAKIGRNPNILLSGTNISLPK